MTMPTLSNCPHSGEGWCLACVKTLEAERRVLKARCNNLVTASLGCLAEFARFGQALGEMTPPPMIDRWNKLETAAKAVVLERVTDSRVGGESIKMPNLTPRAMPFTVTATEREITIIAVTHYGVFNPGNAVLHWDSFAWKDNPSVAVVIANAVKQAYEDPDAFYAFAKRCADTD